MTTTNPSVGEIVAPAAYPTEIETAATMSIHLQGDVTVRWIHHRTGGVGLTLTANGSTDADIYLPLGSELACIDAMRAAVVAALAAPRIGEES